MNNTTSERFEWEYPAGREEIESLSVGDQIQYKSLGRGYVRAPIVETSTEGVVAQPKKPEEFDFEPLPVRVPFDRWDSVKAYRRVPDE